MIEPAEVYSSRERACSYSNRWGRRERGRGLVIEKSSRRGSLKVVRVVEPETMVVKGQLQQ